MAGDRLDGAYEDVFREQGLQSLDQHVDRGLTAARFEHIHGESRDRGQAMVNLLQEYRAHGLLMAADELPDYVPLFLEYLSQRPQADAATLLGDAVHVLALIGGKLNKNGSPYHTVFDVLEALSPVAARPLQEPPVRDMDEAMEIFGPAIDGREPLLGATPQIAYAALPKPYRQTQVSGT